LVVHRNELLFADHAVLREALPLFVPPTLFLELLLAVRGFLPSFGRLWGVVFLVIGAGRDECCFLYEGSVAVTALRTSVMDELPEAWPDLRRWWCIWARL